MSDHDERLLAATEETWASVPASHDPGDPMVWRHATALVVLRGIAAEMRRDTDPQDYADWGSGSQP